jgi:two-component system chemotaxis sensor kinase CheA
MPGLLTPFPTDDEPPMDGDFLAVARYYLSKVELYLRQLEQAPDNSHALEQVYRSTHTVSRVVSQIGYLRLARIVASMEDVFGDALDEILHLDRAAFDVLHRSLERANLLLEVMKTGDGDAGRIDAENETDHAAFRQVRQRPETSWMKGAE